MCNCKFFYIFLPFMIILMIEQNVYKPFDEFNIL